MLGEKKLEMPDNINEAEIIFGLLGLNRQCESMGIVISNARRLVELNNEMYEIIQETNNNIGDLIEELISEYREVEKYTGCIAKKEKLCFGDDCELCKDKYYYNEEQNLLRTYKIKKGGN
ncbi:MAG: hypothetical protein ACFFDF_00300 [Candidatus Odinarchaeota archaeon]